MSNCSSQERCLLSILILRKIRPAGFRPGRSYTGQLLSVTEHIEDVFQKGLLTGAVFVDLSAAYDIVQHLIMLWKLHQMTGDVKLCAVIRSLLKDQMFFVDLDGSKSRWKRQKNGLPQGRVLAPLMFNIYTNDQPEPLGPEHFIYADNLDLISQHKTFKEVKKNHFTALEEMTAYYTINHLNSNPAKTQVCAFQLKNWFDQ